MQEVDILATQRLVALRENALEAFREKHPYIINIVEAVLANVESRLGLQVVDHGQVVGEYTFNLKGIHIVNAEAGKLDLYVKHPLIDLTIRPYSIIEKCVLEDVVSDDRIVREPLQSLMKYLPDITIRFMR